MSIVKVNNKTTKKISTIDKVAIDSIKGITTAKALTIIENANTVIENKTKDKAKGFYAIKTNEKNFKEWFEKNQDKEEKIKGVKYNQAFNLANMYHYVWCTNELKDYDSNKATALVAYVKKDYAKVVSLHNKGVINPSMSKADITDALKEHFGGKSKTVKKGVKENKTEEASKATRISTINEDINLIEKIIEGYCEQLVKKGNCEKHYNNVRSAWNSILNELCK